MLVLTPRHVGRGHELTLKPYTHVILPENLQEHSFLSLKEKGAHDVAKLPGQDSIQRERHSNKVMLLLGRY